LEALPGLIHNDYIIDDEVIEVAAASAACIARFDVQYVACLFQSVMGLYEQDVAIPRISAGAGWQSAKHLDCIDPKDILLMVDVTRLKHQKCSFAWVNIWAIEREVLCRSYEWNTGLNIIKGALFIAEVLSLEKNDGEIGRHGSNSLA